MNQWESESYNAHQKSPISLLTRITLCRPVPISNTEELLTSGTDAFNKSFYKIFTGTMDF